VGRALLAAGHGRRSDGQPLLDQYYHAQLVGAGASWHAAGACTYTQHRRRRARAVVVVVGDDNDFPDDQALWIGAAARAVRAFLLRVVLVSCAAVLPLSPSSWKELGVHGHGRPAVKGRGNSVDRRL